MIDNSSHFENIFSELKFKTANLDKYQVCNVYKPPTGVADNLKDFINTFHLWTNDISNRSKIRTFVVISTSIYCKFKRMTVIVNFIIT